MAWEDTLQEAAWKGVPFTCRTLSEQRGRALVERQYPHRDGADIDDLGREPIRMTIEAVFIEPDYPDGLRKLLAAIDEGGSGEFVHPLAGTFQAAAERGDVQYSGDEPDSATVTITFVEDGAAAVLALPSPAASAQAVREKALTIELLIDEDLPAAIQAAADETVEEARTFAAAMEEPETPARKLTLSDIRAALNRLRALVQALIELVQALMDPRNWPLVNELCELASAADQLATMMENLRPPAIPYELTHSRCAVLVAHQLYGDRNRAGEFCAENGIRDPNRVPPGSYRAYAG